MESELSPLLYAATGGLLIIVLVGFLAFVYFWFVSTLPGRRLPHPSFWKHVLASGLCVFFSCSALSAIGVLWTRLHNWILPFLILSLVAAVLAADIIASGRKLDDFLIDYLTRRGVLNSPPEKE